MRKSTTMIAAIAMVFLFVMGTGFAQDQKKAAMGCCPMMGNKKKTSKMRCPMKKGMSKVDIQKMMQNCPMIKNMSVFYSVY